MFTSRWFGRQALPEWLVVLWCAVLWCAVQAIDWLKATIKASGESCEVVAHHDPHFLNSLELAVRFGSVRDTLRGDGTAI